MLWTCAQPAFNGCDLDIASTGHLGKVDDQESVSSHCLKIVYSGSTELKIQICSHTIITFAKSSLLPWSSTARIHLVLHIQQLVESKVLKKMEKLLMWQDNLVQVALFNRATLENSGLRTQDI